MINNISSVGSCMAMMRSSGSQAPPPPKGNDVFQVGDSDGDGVISSSELTTLTETIGEVTGNSISVEDAIISYDTNQDGGLSGEELLEMLTSNGFNPQMMDESGDLEMMPPPPPPPPSSDQALTAYRQNSGEDEVGQLLELLLNSDAEGDYTSVDTTS